MYRLLYRNIREKIQNKLKKVGLGFSTFNLTTCEAKGRGLLCTMVHSEMYSDL